ncbi:alpha/beta fold hydrolase [Ktedonospora formicarum]|uniref:Alpha/beta hydrolase n=1 Tax=Ktedonospora formicarum TaxID=2778364 RepID=A0A8J3I6T9_9CHLR|nr:alpha/beta hydrolase [Ktedonospora formicarum]GHO46504.1 alpha/beta hydrolase [Ktedonospora formicarum]
MNVPEILQPYTTSTVISADGTVIGYRQFGSGPGVVLMHGGMQASQLMMALGISLADKFTIYIPDRRGRGMSGAPGDGYGMVKECEDLAALLKKTGAHLVFGLSSGALISLQAALTLSGIEKVALYEPPLSIDHSIPRDWVPQYLQEIAERRFTAALITVLKGLQMDTDLPDIPRAVLEPLVEQRLRGEDLSGRPDDVSMWDLIPTQRLDMMLVDEMEETLASFKDMKADVLLLSGEKSPAFLREQMDALGKVLPRSERVEFPGFGHTAPSEDGAERVGEELRRFFVADNAD